jgi:SAM-dependent methyltransferase
MVTQHQAAPEIIACFSRRAWARRCQQLAAGAHGPGILRPLVTDSFVEQLPALPGRFDGVLSLAGLPWGDEPVAVLRSLRQLLVPGGVLVVASSLREAPGSSLVAWTRARGRRRLYPRAAELTQWMLAAGLRLVRQAQLRRGVVPTVVTWAEARSRPWESSPISSCGQ